METMDRTIAQAILELREEAGFSQLALATEADIALKTLHAAEHAAGNLKINTLEKIAGALGDPAGRLLDGMRSAPPGLDALVELLTDRPHK